MTYEFSVIGIPKGSPRPRAFTRGKHASVFVPPQADDWKSCVRAAVRLVTFDDPPMLDGPVRLSIIYRLPRPKSSKKRDRTPWHTTKPDLDNMDKATMDALSEAGVWNDDRQVAFKESSKVYADAGESIGASIVVIELSPQKGST